jgi:hypothetical protein
MKYIYILLMSAVFSGTVSAEMRVWQTADGRSFKAEFLREKFGLFYFRDENQQIQKVTVTDLVPSHVRYIRTMIPPEITLSYRKKMYKEKGRNADQDVTLVDGTVKITKSGTTPFEGVLSGELYFVAKEVATDHYMMLARKKFAIRFPKGKNQAFEFTMSARTRVYNEYNNLQTRGRNYEGYLLVVTSPSGDILGIKTDLGWLDEDKIPTLRRFDVFNFFDKDCRKKSVPRPKYYSGRGFI